MNHTELHSLQCPKLNTRAVTITVSEENNELLYNVRNTNNGILSIEFSKNTSEEIDTVLYLTSKDSENVSLNEKYLLEFLRQNGYKKSNEFKYIHIHLKDIIIKTINNEKISTRLVLSISGCRIECQYQDFIFSHDFSASDIVSLSSIRKFITSNKDILEYVSNNAEFILKIFQDLKYLIPSTFIRLNSYSIRNSITFCRNLDLHKTMDIYTSNQNEDIERYNVLRERVAKHPKISKFNIVIKGIKIYYSSQRRQILSAIPFLQPIPGNELDYAKFIVSYFKSINSFDALMYKLEGSLIEVL